jgi:hypothetical protein
VIGNGIDALNEVSSRNTETRLCNGVTRIPLLSRGHLGARDVPPVIRGHEPIEFTPIRREK